MAKITYPTDAELAVTQQAIGDAYDAWVQRVEGSVDWRGFIENTSPPDVSEAPAFSELVAADAADMAIFSSDVQEAIRDAASGR